MVSSTGCYPRDLECVLGTEWINSAFIESILNKLDNNNNSDTVVIDYNSFFSKNISITRKIRYVMIILNVGMGGEYIADVHKPGCHWSCAYFDIESATVTYCDSFA